MARKILFVSNTANFSKFNLPFMRWFKEQGWQVDYASLNDEKVLFCDKHHSIAMVRNPFSLKNIKAIYKLRDILDEEQYDIIHCHTNIGAMVARLAAKKLRKNGLKVIYTLHGAYFYKGAPLINWLFYYPIEKYLSRYTDALILINQEDYDNAFGKIKIPFIYKIDGVGVDIKRFYPVSELEKSNLRKKLGYQNHDFIILYIAEFVSRKNHIYLIKEISEIRKVIPNMKVIFAGKGVLMEKCKNMAILMRETETVSFLGYRDDIPMLCQIADIHVSVSKMEGLAINNIEAMASGLPIVCSKIRGHIDVVDNGRNGFLFELTNPDEMVYAISKLFNSAKLRYEIAKNNVQDAQKYSVDIAVSKMASIYTKFMP
jgi:glycosyltransferase EpsD